jgi:hypothetical protein
MPASAIPMRGNERKAGSANHLVRCKQLATTFPVIVAYSFMCHKAVLRLFHVHEGELLLPYLFFVGPFLCSL